MKQHAQLARLPTRDVLLLSAGLDRVLSHRGPRGLRAFPRRLLDWRVVVVIAIRLVVDVVFWLLLWAALEAGRAAGLRGRCHRVGQCVREGDTERSPMMVALRRRCWSLATPGRIGALAVGVNRCSGRCRRRSPLRVRKTTWHHPPPLVSFRACFRVEIPYALLTHTLREPLQIMASKTAVAAVVSVGWCAHGVRIHSEHFSWAY